MSEEKVKWDGHAYVCDKCKSVVYEKSATFSKSCFEGSRLLRDSLASDAAAIASAKTRAENKMLREMFPNSGTPRMVYK